MHHCPHGPDNDSKSKMLLPRIKVVNRIVENRSDYIHWQVNWNHNISLLEQVSASDLAVTGSKGICAAEQNLRQELEEPLMFTHHSCVKK
jgi:hypothetical protein